MDRIPSLYDRKYNVSGITKKDTTLSSAKDWYSILNVYKGPIEISLIKDRENIKFVQVNKKEEVNE